MLFKILKALNDTQESNALSDKAMEVLEMYYALHHPLEYLITKTNDSD